MGHVIQVDTVDPFIMVNGLAIPGGIVVEIIGFEELMHNANVAEVDERGYTKRSTAKDNLEGTNTLGSFLVRDIHTGVAFSIGTGFTQEQRSDFWKYKQHYLGCFVKYKFFPGGMKDKPRFPVFLGFRDQEDMS